VYISKNGFDDLCKKFENSCLSGKFKMESWRQYNFPTKAEQTMKIKLDHIIHAIVMLW
jgi:hypothetical protein